MSEIVRRLSLWGELRRRGVGGGGGEGDGGGEEAGGRERGLARERLFF